jgi:hypothetical protein
MKEIDLIFDVDCPHVEEARRLLRDALRATGLPPHWREWNRAAPDTPPSLRSVGSPTIVIDGRDVSTDAPPTTDHEVANSCRIYHDGRELRGVPPFDVVTRALASAKSGLR